MLHVVVLDPHPAIRAGLRRLIASEPDLEVAATADTPAALARQLDGRRADVLVVDHGRAFDGLAHCRRVKERANPPAVVIYAAQSGPGLVLAARAAQADAVVGKADRVDTLLTAIREVAAGRRHLPPVPHEAFEIAVGRLEAEDLPVFAMLLDGERPSTIAEALRIDDTEAARRAKRVIARLRARQPDIEPVLGG
jgi:DNA-binding NarL/FixJ family response regulator